MRTTDYTTIVSLEQVRLRDPACAAKLVIEKARSRRARAFVLFAHFCPCLGVQVFEFCGAKDGAMRTPATSSSVYTVRFNPRTSSRRPAMPTQLPYIICTAVVIVLNAGPLVWQFKQGNSGPIALGVWIMVGCINELVRPKF